MAQTPPGVSHDPVATQDSRNCCRLAIVRGHAGGVRHGEPRTSSEPRCVNGLSIFPHVPASFTQNWHDPAKRCPANASEITSFFILSPRTLSQQWEPGAATAWDAA